MFALAIGIITTKQPFSQNGGNVLQAKVEKEDLSKEKETLKTIFSYILLYVLF